MELSHGINILLGANNSGKSTIIKALFNLQYPTTFSIKDIRAKSNASRILVEITDIEKVDETLFTSKTNIPEIKYAKGVNTFWGLVNSGTASEQFKFGDSTSQLKEIEDGSFGLTDENGAKANFTNFSRFPDSEDKNNFIYPFLSRRKTEFYDPTINRNETFRVLEGLRNLGAKINRLSNSSHPMNEEFNRLCIDILGFRIGTIPAEDSNNGGEPGIYVDQSTMISIRSMGEGVANIVGFIVILLTDNRKLFLLEELENDIHPKALKKLLDLIVMKSEHNQFVISTHSHIVLKNLGIVDSSKLFYVDWVPGDINNVRIPTSNVSLIENTPEGRMGVLEKLGYDFFDFDLYKSYLLLEESTAERLIRDFLIPFVVPGLSNKIKTIAARGVDDLKLKAQDFNRLFVFIHTSPIYKERAWIIADGDAPGKAIISELSEQFKRSWPKDHFINFSRGNFEEYYPTRFDSRTKEVLALSHGPKKQDEKSKLLNEVMDWINNNQKEAIDEFSVSAKEVIDVLKEIDKKLTTI